MESGLEEINNLLKSNFFRLKNYLRRKIGNEEELEDVFQEVLISASQAYPRFSGKSTFFTWLCGIANHEVVDYYRKKKIKSLLFSHFPWLENLANQALGPEQVLLREEFEQKVQRIMGNLHEGYAEVLRLKYYYGLSVAQIAEKLDENCKTVESRLTRARKAFAKAYTAYGY